MSENLSKIAQKIDFSKTNGEESKKTGEQNENSDKNDEESKDPATFQASSWPWDSVRTKLR